MLTISNWDLLKIAFIPGFAEFFQESIHDQNCKAEKDAVDLEEGSASNQCCYSNNLECKTICIQTSRNFFYCTLIISTLSGGGAVLAAFKSLNKESVLAFSIMSSVSAIGCLLSGTRLYFDAKTLQNKINNNYFKINNTSSQRTDSQRTDSNATVS